MKREDLVNAALDMLDTPFHAQGRAPGVGLDCIGLIVCAAKQAGFEPEDRAAYPMRPDGTLKPSLEKQLIRVTGNPQSGDVLLMAFDGNEPHHVAMYIGNNMIVHAYAQVRKVSLQTYSKYWKDKVKAIYRFPEVE